MIGKTREVCIRYCFDKNEVMFTLGKETYHRWSMQSAHYEITKFDDYYELYNVLIEDFDVEYDEDICEGLEVLCQQFWKEKDEVCDTVTQE